MIVLLIVIVILAIGLSFKMLMGRVGRLGNSVYYSFNERTGTAVIFGKGDMLHFFGFFVGFDRNDKDYTLQYSDFRNKSSLKKVIVTEGVTNVSICAFAHCQNLQTVYLPSTVTEVGPSSFFNCPSITGIYFSGNAPTVSEEFLSTKETTVIYHKPGTTGWDDPVWDGFKVVEQDFQIDWSPVG